MDTKMLAKKIKNQVNRLFPELVLNQINFHEGTDSSPEGTYFFFKNDKYHIVFTEKGKIRTHKESNNINDVLWEVLDIILFDVAMNYALENKENGKDFRRTLFKKEIELYEKFGKEFKNRKVNEIKYILEQNPYSDER